MHALLGSLTSLSASLHADLSDIGPKWDAPFLTGLKSIAGWVISGSYVVVVIILVIGVVAMVAGKITKSSFQDSGMMIIVWVLIGAAIIGGGTQAITWAMGWNIFG
jgi:hypothetical protein